MLPMDQYLGKLAEVRFYDHVTGEDIMEAAVCVVWGRIIHVSNRAIVVQHWETDSCTDVNSGNNVLLCSAIYEIRELK